MLTESTAALKSVLFCIPSINYVNYLFTDEVSANKDKYGFKSLPVKLNKSLFSQFSLTIVIPTKSFDNEGLKKFLLH